MKKKYIAPTMGITNIELCCMIATSVVINTNTENSVGADQSLSNERGERQWGNIWND